MALAYDDVCDTRACNQPHLAFTTRLTRLASNGADCISAWLCFATFLIWILVNPATASLIATSTFTQTATSTIVTALPIVSNCSAVEWCAQDHSCSACFKTVHNVLFNSVSLHQAALYERLFLETLHNTTACSTVNLDPVRFHGALMDIFNNQMCLQILNPDSTYSGVPFGSKCQIEEYECFINSTCSGCLLELYTNHSHSAKILNSSSCVNMSNVIAQRLAHWCPGFPSCSWSKLLCNRSVTCTSCWEKLLAGDGVAASRQCRGTDTDNFDAGVMDFLVGRCMVNTQPSCDFFLDRCAEAPYCSACLDHIGDVGSGDAGAIVRGMSSPTCVNATISSGWEVANVFSNCPQYTACQRATSTCIYLHPSCLLCLNGSAYKDSNCDFILSLNE